MDSHRWILWFWEKREREREGRDERIGRVEDEDERKTKERLVMGDVQDYIIRQGFELGYQNEEENEEKRTSLKPGRRVESV